MFQFTNHHRRMVEWERGAERPSLHLELVTIMMNTVPGISSPDHRSPLGDGVVFTIFDIWGRDPQKIFHF